MGGEAQYRVLKDLDKLIEEQDKITRFRIEKKSETVSCSVMSNSWRPHGLYYISLPVSSICGLLQARTLGWVAIPFSRGSSPPRDGRPVSRTAGRLCRRSHEGGPVYTGHLATPTSPQAWAEVAHGMFSPQKYKLPGSSKDTLPGPGDPWQSGSDSICGCALH